jgi:hypothetical protein
MGTSDGNGLVNAVVVAAACGVLVYMVYSYTNRADAPLRMEGLQVAPDDGLALPRDPMKVPYQAVEYPVASMGVQDPADDCFPKDRLTAADLLPKDAANSQWAQANPAGQGDVAGSNFLTAGHHVGINTVAGSLRNANLQLRSEVPNPRGRVSVWNESTIEPDLHRRPLEIDGAC